MRRRSGHDALCRTCDAWLRFRCVGKPEEGKGIPVTEVEKEMLSHSLRQLDRLDKRNAKHIAVEVNRARDIIAHQRQMIDALKFEFLVLRHRSLPVDGKSVTRCADLTNRHARRTETELPSGAASRDRSTAGGACLRPGDIRRSI